MTVLTRLLLRDPIILAKFASKISRDTIVSGAVDLSICQLFELHVCQLFEFRVCQLLELRVCQLVYS